MADPTNMERTWLCSVLFMDIVQYSTQSVDLQMTWKKRFNGYLADAIKDVPEGDRVILDTGDGAAVCFLGAPEVAMFAALQVCGQFVVDEREQRQGLRVRIGINLGPVKLIRDINGALNAIGDGINAGQRIMSFAAVNQILVSQSFFEVVSRLSDDYKKLFALKGIEKDKHVREHTVYHLAPPGSSATAPAAEEPAVPPPPPAAPLAQAAPLAPAIPASSPAQPAPQNRSILWLAIGAALVVLAAVGVWRFSRPAVQVASNSNVGAPVPAAAAPASTTKMPAAPAAVSQPAPTGAVATAPVASAPAKITPAPPAPSQPESAPTVAPPVVTPPVPPVVRSAPRAGDSKVNSRDGLKYVFIPPGKFTMGCSPGDNECNEDEKPAHEVDITNGFWLGQTTATAGAWKRYRTAAGKPALAASDSLGRKLNEASADDTVPAVAMTWSEARNFCEWGGGRLPTEAEWEYAARAGRNGARYGNLDAIAWFGDNSGNKKIDSGEIWRTDQANYTKRLVDNGNGLHPVGQKQPNAWNLYDMLGNVWQWTADWYAPQYYAQRENADPAGPPGGKERTLRGGFWFNYPPNVRVSVRNGTAPESRNVSFGVRCAGS
jgi:formylglycine-generating enzyme required for sulfatase activity/class 3 adenylate cyclase